MFLYHEIHSNSLKPILQDGLKCTTRGEKGSDQNIIKTDRYLDSLRPSDVKDIGLSRSNNLYAFIGDTDTIIDIKDGATVSLKKYMADRRSILLQLTVNPKYCYVSDLDKYDEVKSLLLSDNMLQAHKHALDYWNSIINFSVFQPDAVRRPEVMIVRDLLPDTISPIS